MIVIVMLVLFIITISPEKTVAAGSVLYSINFSSYANGSQPPSWNHDPGFSALNGLYATNTSTPGHGEVIAYYTGSTFSNFRFTALATGMKYCGPGQLQPVLALAFRVQDRNNGYWFWGDIDKIQIIKWVNGNPTALIVSPPYDSVNIGQIAPLGTFNMTVISNGNTLTAIWNNQFTISVQDPTFASGFVGVATYNCGAGFNNIQVSSLVPISSSSSVSTSSSSKTSTTATTTTTKTSTLVAGTIKLVCPSGNPPTVVTTNPLVVTCP